MYQLNFDISCYKCFPPSVAKNNCLLIRGFATETFKSTTKFKKGRRRSTSFSIWGYLCEERLYAQWLVPLTGRDNRFHAKCHGGHCSTSPLRLFSRATLTFPTEALAFTPHTLTSVDEKCRVWDIDYSFTLACYDEIFLGNTNVTQLKFCLYYIHSNFYSQRGDQR